MTNLNTAAVNTWCPGCGNFAILTAMKTVLSSLAEEGLPIENVVIVSGIGCHAKMIGEDQGDVISVFSSSLDMTGEYSQLQQNIAMMI